MSLAEDPASPQSVTTDLPEVPSPEPATADLPDVPSFSPDENLNIQERIDLEENQSAEAQLNGDISKDHTQQDFTLTEAEVQRLMKQEDERRKQKNGRRGRLRELEETRTELAEKQLELLQKEKELLDRDQSLAVLREELELERRIRALLTREKEQAVEEAALARGLCAGASLLP